MAERRSPRIRHELPVRLFRAGGVLQLKSVDVSREGMFFLTTLSPKPRELLKIEVDLPHGQPLKCMATVARVVPGPPPGLGVQFFAMAPEARERWEKYLRTLEPNAPPEERIFTPTRYPPQKALYVLRPRDTAALKSFLDYEIAMGEMHLDASDEPVDVGDKVNIFVVHPTTEDEFELCGEVVRSTMAMGDRPEGIGVELLDRGEELRARFARFVETGKSA